MQIHNTRMSALLSEPVSESVSEQSPDFQRWALAQEKSIANCFQSINTVQPVIPLNSKSSPKGNRHNWNYDEFHLLE